MILKAFMALVKPRQQVKTRVDVTESGGDGVYFIHGPSETF